MFIRKKLVFMINNDTAENPRDPLKVLRISILAGGRRGWVHGGVAAIGE